MKILYHPEINDVMEHYIFIHIPVEFCGSGLSKAEYKLVVVYGSDKCDLVMSVEHFQKRRLPDYDEVSIEDIPTYILCKLCNPVEIAQVRLDLTNVAERGIMIL